MTTEFTTPEHDLALAFAAKDGQQSDGTVPPQDGQTGVVDTNPDPSREDTGADPSHSDAKPLTKEAVLASLTLDDLLGHPTLKPTLQSWADGKTAGELRGKTAAIERQVRERVQLELASKHFDSLSPDELGQELEDPDARRLYAAVQNQPPPPPPEATAQIGVYTALLRTNRDKIQSAGLDPEIAASLDPEKHLKVAGDPDELMTKWIRMVDDAIVDHRVNAKVGKAGETDAKAKELEAQADADEGKQGGAVMEPGRRTSPLPDLLADTSTNQLANAFRQTAPVRR